MFKLALANASRHVLLRSRVEEVISYLCIKLCYEICLHLQLLTIRVLQKKSLANGNRWLINDLQGRCKHFLSMKRRCGFAKRPTFIMAAGH